MPQLRPHRKDFNAQRAAFLCGEHGLSQGEIGRMLDLSQSAVSRLLKYAEHRKWLERRYRFIPDGLPADRLQYLRRLVEPNQLIDRLTAVESETGVRVRDVHVVDTGSSGESQKAIAARQTRFGRAAARTVADLMLRSDVFAVTWGRTISHIVEAIREIVPVPATGRAIRFVPVCCEPTHEKSNPDTSSHLAEQLHMLLRASVPGRPPSLSGVPALIPRRFRGSDARGIRKFVEQAASYREMFGDRGPLIRQVDALLTSVGPAKRPMGFVNEELRSAGSVPGRPLTKEQLERLVVGDVGGVLLPRRDLDRADRREVDQLNAMWTGITREHLERIAAQAARTRRPGVIVASFGGAGRAETIAEAVRCGLVNELIIDRQLAEALTEVLSPPTTGQRGRPDESA
jgi:DNA-binding transcriptional regulator LsrR (DeoR family)